MKSRGEQKDRRHERAGDRRSQHDAFDGIGRTAGRARCERGALRVQSLRVANPAAGQLGAPVAAEASSEPWPICTTMGSLGDVADWAQLDPDFLAGKKALSVDDWNGAITALKLAALRDPQNADIQNYIGYAYRRLRQLELALAHYQKALIFNSRHRSAHEHLGEAYLVKGNLIKAQEHLAALQDICLIPCIEYDDLQTAIAAYKTFATR
jgi:tetratricopeptide (TPR) repeat protein